MEPTLPSFKSFTPARHYKSYSQTTPKPWKGLLDVRELLEGEAAALAAERATATDRINLEQAYEAVIAEYSDAQARDAHASEDHAERDLAFHRAIYVAAHNPVLLLALNGIRDLFMNFIYDTSEKLFASSAVRRQINTQHRRIYRAITEGDANAARRAAKAHICAVAEQLKA